MAAYQQLGHQSDNLLFEDHLSAFAGAILSPVNYAEQELAAVAAKARFRRGYDVIFDPQLYFPRTQRHELRNWSYFPSDVDSADMADEAWWDKLVGAVVEACERVKVDGICSPSILPREFSEAYFDSAVATGNKLASALEHSGSRPLQTAIVGLDYIVDHDHAMSTGSILSKTKCEEIYLVLVGPDVEPRRELSDTEQLKGAMTLIAALQTAGLSVLVAFASSDLLLWKSAGAAHCATGKFFNLRRFTRTRFEEPPAKGGGALPYWFEESLVAFLRGSDLARVRPLGLLDGTERENPYAREIRDLLTTTPAAPWMALGWKQFLWWFAHAEQRLASDNVHVDGLLEAAENNWLRLQQATPRMLMEEAANSGAWLRAWRRAVLEYLV